MEDGRSAPRRRPLPGARHSARPPHDDGGGAALATSLARAPRWCFSEGRRRTYRGGTPWTRDAPRASLASFGLELGRSARRVTSGRRARRRRRGASLLAQAGVAREPMADAGLQLRPPAPIAAVATTSWVNRGATHSRRLGEARGYGQLGRSPRPAVRRQDGRGVARTAAGAGEVYLQLAPGRVARSCGRSRAEPGSGEPLAVRRGRRRPGAGGRPLAARFRRGRPSASRAPPSCARSRRGRRSPTRRPSASPAPAATRVRLERPGGDAVDWLLDLGGVAETARVTLNGRRLGTLCRRPFRAAPRRRAAPRDEHARDRGDEPRREPGAGPRPPRGPRGRRFHDANVVNIDYKPLDASAWPLRDSGLLGPGDPAAPSEARTARIGRRAVYSLFPRRNNPMRRLPAAALSLALLPAVSSAQAPAASRAAGRLPRAVRGAARRPEVPRVAEGLRPLRGRGAHGLPGRRGLRLRRPLPLRRGERRPRRAEAGRGAGRLLRRLDHGQLVEAGLRRLLPRASPT